MDEYNTLIQGWQNRTKNLFPGDNIIQDEEYSVNLTSPEEYILSELFNDPNDNKYHIGLSPLPFLGNLAQASVFILTLNPGLHVSDYFTETHPVFQAHLDANFNQTLNPTEYPLFFLNPALGFHAGFTYWNRFLKVTREALHTRLKHPRNEVQKFLAREIAVLEFIPYHARRGPKTNKSIKSMPSVKAVTAYARNILEPRALNEEILILNVRRVQDWGLKTGRNILTNFTQTVSLDPEGSNGKKLLEFLLERFN